MQCRQHYDGTVSSVVAETACGQELDLISVGGNSGLHLKEVQERAHEQQLTQLIV